jgi:acetolactate synthase-1/2/3 large subunit
VNGAESLVRSLLASGIDTCFANPGTSEMHFVAALDRAPGMRCVLGLAETVVTGCADGYARMREKPAATLMHCGPGFANGICNIHNARRALSPMVNIVGDQATYHRPHDAPLTADTLGLAEAISHWVRASTSSAHVGRDGAAAVQAARKAPGQIATLILPADVSWNEGGEVGAALPVDAPLPVDAKTIDAIARVLKRGEKATIVLSGAALTERGLAAAERVAHASGAELRTPMQVARMARGRTRASVDRIPYMVDRALESLAGAKHIVLAAAKPPVAFFAYPGKPSLLAPPGSTTHVLAQPEEDVVAALESLADALGAPTSLPPRNLEVPQGRTGPFDPVAFAWTFGALIPRNAVVVEEGVTSGRALFAPSFGAAPHDWLQVTGGAIGQGLPCATGAAIGAPDRKVIALEADGSGMYSLQALWTQAREKLDIVNVIFANRVYKILQGELQSVGAQPGPASKALFDIGGPDLDWVKLSEGMGVEAMRVETLEAFADVFRAACSKRGPFLIELVC